MAPGPPDAARLIAAFAARAPTLSALDLIAALSRGLGDDVRTAIEFNVRGLIEDWRHAALHGLVVGSSGSREFRVFLPPPPRMTGTLLWPLRRTLAAVWSDAANSDVYAVRKASAEERRTLRDSIRFGILGNRSDASAARVVADYVTAWAARQTADRYVERSTRLMLDAIPCASGSACFGGTHATPDGSRQPFPILRDRRRRGRPQERCGACRENAARLAYRMQEERGYLDPRGNGRRVRQKEYRSLLCDVQVERESGMGGFPM